MCADQKSDLVPVLVSPRRLTWLEAIQKNNDAGRVLASTTICSRILGRSDIPEARPIYSGTAAAVGPLGKAWRSVETRCGFDKRMIETIFDARTEQEADVAVIRNHGFGADGTPAIGLYDAKGQLVRLCDAKGDPIGEMPERVFVRFNGPPSRARIKDRDGWGLETVEGEDLFTEPLCHWVDHSAVLGLLSRSMNESSYAWYVQLKDRPSHTFGVVVEAAESGAAEKTRDPRISAKS